MQNIRYFLTTLFLITFTLLAQAQDPVSKSGFGETMRSNGRIYVVVAVMVTILLGLILYLVRLDKKISKLEKDS